MRWWSEEEIEYLREHYPDCSRKQLLEMFKQKFNVEISISQLEGALQRYNIKSGRTGKFENGQAAWNKGMKGISFGGENSKRTQFKAGNTPYNFKPVGTERVDQDGYILIKVSDYGPWHKRWRHKHCVVWEKANGPIPKGHAVIFGDGNRLNVDIDNLILVTRKQLATLNKHKLIQDHAELTKTGIIVADIYLKMGERKKDSKE